ncbi:hypothetical protein F3N42_07870 [Marinihelvus fidelis]|uniref:Uncharacterized protein n=1 Tax=Marinihelvus fidelis TaxID=2613842 RepID=A0A5N0TDC7_9GAMM|nr:hypothetical protein [Marinihelvus fidelis]KAA9132077.1 hypothetical protein F3N42_07870 [Marinihelvus fidelis]
MKFSEVFSDVLGPSSEAVPFADPTWIGVAFARDAYDNTRFPEWFFQCVMNQFAISREVDLLVAGDCFVQLGLEEVFQVPFQWESYQAFMMEPEHYSIEYRVVSSNRTCGWLSDGDITIFGGEEQRMTLLIERIGGIDKVLDSMRAEFFLGEKEKYSELDHFLQSLLRPALRPCRN